MAGVKVAMVNEMENASSATEHQRGGNRSPGIPCSREVTTQHTHTPQQANTKKWKMPTK